MPSEKISQSDGARLTLQWGKPGTDLDPSVILTSWREQLDTNGAHADWEPLFMWHLEPETCDDLIRVLQRARAQAYGEPAATNITINVHGTLTGPSADFVAAAVRRGVSRYDYDRENRSLAADEAAGRPDARETTRPIDQYGRAIEQENPPA